MIKKNIKKIIIILLSVLLIIFTCNYINNNIIDIEGFNNDELDANGVVIFTTNQLYDILKTLNGNKFINDIKINKYDNFYICIDTY